MAKFKVLSKVHRFGFRGQRYLPGDIVECSEEDAAGFNLDFLERVPEADPSVEVSVVDVATAAAMVGPELKPETLIVHPKTLKKVKPKVLPKVPQ
jgi:hypothetical protein